MNTSEIIRYRLLHQQIAETSFTKVADIVRWMGAMQAQQYAMAKWAIGLRGQRLIDEDVEKAFNNGTILRTHLLRPTWHFVHPADIRWMLQLTAPRVHAVNACMYRKTELDAGIFKKSLDCIAASLEGKNYLTRPVLKEALERKKIMADGIRLSYIMMYAELEGLICSGPRDGKQFTYALLEERVPAVQAIDREDALSRLTACYFTSRGPATIQDYVTWSGLTVKEATLGIGMLSRQFETIASENKTYFLIPSKTSLHKQSQTTFLMPDYDEYGMGYKDRSVLSNPMDRESDVRKNLSDYSHMLVVDGQIRGTWSANVKGKNTTVSTELFTPLSKGADAAIKKAIQKYERFVGNIGE